jgi:hypothetical protein
MDLILESVFCRFSDAMNMSDASTSMRSVLYGMEMRSGFSPAEVRCSPHFPAVYATVFSGFYIALMLLLAALIFRAVSFEFRNKVDSPTWRHQYGIGHSDSEVFFQLFSLELP